MATGVNGNTKRMYSWWWDSHISPKNSKWLKENLNDMDSKVKQMIKLIEEDADSFARRAEMYYRQRPELMKLVEEFYRAYRALAERYDHATGVIRHAHRTMAEVFPNQNLFGDESPAGGSTNETDPRTPEMPPQIGAIDPDELQKYAFGVSPSHIHALKRNGAFTDESESVNNRKGLQQLDDLLGSGGGSARKGLNFHDGHEKGSNGSHDLKGRSLSESERVSKAEAEIMALKDALAKLQAEKETSLHQYEQSLERLSDLESEVSRAQVDSRGLNERASKAEAEVQTLKDTLRNLESEKESSFLQYQQCLQKIAGLENSISRAQKDAGETIERASKAEAETQALKQVLAGVKAEKEAALTQYEQCLQNISNLEEKLRKAEEDVQRINERAEKAESEVENLKQTISKLVEEKEASAFQYQQCLDTIADLKLKLLQAQEEAQRLSRELENGVAKLKIAEEKCDMLERSNQTLHSELDSLLQKLGTQSQQLSEKQKELGRLWTSVQEERLRFLEAETAFQTLQHLHSQSQEELRSLAAELQTRAQILKDMEIRNSDLQEEVQEVKEENKGLNELNLSSAASIKSLQEEISSLRETIQKLEAEVELRVDQRNALQQEIYCLKEELNEITKKHQAVMEQVELVDLSPDCLGSSVKELQDENSKLKDVSEREKSEKLALLEKLEIMEKLVEKNILLENSISDLSAELEAVRGKMKELEDACQSLLDEKSSLVAEKDALISRLQIATENSEKLSDKNKCLENSLFDANAELEELRIKLKRLEDSCLVLDSEKSGLIIERETLVSQLEITRKSLENLEKGHAELKMKVLALEMERESSLQKIEELGVSLDAKNQEYTTFVQLSEAQISDMELQIHHLQVQNQHREQEYIEELDRGVNSQIETFILQTSLQDLQEKNVSLMVEYQGIKGASKLSQKLISDLKHENHGQQLQIESLVDRIKMLRMGLFQVMKRIELDPDTVSDDETEQEQTVIHNILRRLEERQKLLLKTQDENQQSAIEVFVLVALLQQLKSEGADIATEKSILDQEYKTRCQQLLALQSEAEKLNKMNEELTSKVKERGHREEVLKAEIENCRRQVLELQGAYKHLDEANCKTMDEKRFLTKSVQCLEEEKRELEEELALMLAEAMYQSSLALIFKDIISDKLLELKELSEDLGKLRFIKAELEEKVEATEGKLKEAQAENSELKESMKMLESELSSVRSITDQLNHEISNEKDLFSQKEKELLEALAILAVLQNEKTELSKTVEDLKFKYDEIKAIQAEQEKTILELRADNDDQTKETGRVSEVNQNLQADMQKLLMELEETKQEREKLNYELLKERNEAELWESQAAAFFGKLQISAVNEVFLEGKTHELTGACENLEVLSASKDMDIGQLKGRVSSLEDENKGLKTHMAKYAQAVALLDDSIKSLEKHIPLRQKCDSEVLKDANSAANLQAESHQGTSEDGFTDLYAMHSRIKAIEEAVIERESFVMLENSNANSQLEAALRQVEELKAGARRSKKKQEEDGRRQKKTREISEEESEVITKDIMLDQISDSSVSRRRNLEVDDLMLESWETAGGGSGIDLKLEKPHKVDNKGKTPSEESLVVDKLEISDRFADPNQQPNKRKVLERLDSDLQKLANLQITIKDLKGKVEINDKGQKVKGDEYDTIKEQLEEAEEAILKLYDVNRKLMSKAENGFVPSDGKSADFDEIESARRRRISEQARRGSEKIGRLQLEIQRIQFLLLKLDGERENRAKAKVSERNTRVLLRDYIYGGMRVGQKKKKKKTMFCACVQPHSP